MAETNFSQEGEPPPPCGTAFAFLFYEPPVNLVLLTSLSGWSHCSKPNALRRRSGCGSSRQFFSSIPLYSINLSQEGGPPPPPWGGSRHLLRASHPPTFTHCFDIQRCLAALFKAQCRPSVFRMTRLSLGVKPSTLFLGLLKRR